MKFFYAIVLVLIVFVSACAQQQPAQPIQPTVQPTPQPQAQPEPEEVVEEEAEEEEVVLETTLSEIRYVGAGGFDPSELTISVGSAVIWINNDDKAGALLIFKDGKSFTNSKRLIPKAKFEFEFTEAGEYDFWWNLALGEVSGKITVE